MTTTQVSGDRDQWADVVKGIAIIGVVLFHAASLATVGLPQRVWHVAGFGLFLFIMPVFFVVGGIFTARHLTLTFGAYLARRVWPIFYLFAAWAALYALLSLASNGRFGATLESSLILKSTLWFLAAYVVYLLIAWVLARLSVAPLIQVLGAAVLGLPFAIWFPFDAWGLGHTPHFLVAFLIGTNYGPRVLAWSQGVGWRTLGICILGASALGVLALLIRPTANVVYALLPLFVVPAVLIVSRLIQRMGKAASILATIGSASLTIYLVHPLIQSAFAWAIAVAGIAAPFYSIAYPVACTLVAVVVGTVLGRQLAFVPFLFRAPRLGNRQTDDRSIQKLPASVEERASDGVTRYASVYSPDEPL
jgi:fucose 4-O-acetylase-like acetyltransferase